MGETYRLTITHGDDVGSTRTLSLAGELDAYTAPELEAALADHGPDGTRPSLRVDLSRVTFMDSTGLRVIIRADNELTAAGRQLVLVAPSAPVSRLFELTALDDRFVIESGVLE